MLVVDKIGEIHSMTLIVEIHMFSKKKWDLTVFLQYCKSRVCVCDPRKQQTNDPKKTSTSEKLRFLWNMSCFSMAAPNTSGTFGW